MNAIHRVCSPLSLSELPSFEYIHDITDFPKPLGYLCRHPHGRSCRHRPTISQSWPLSGEEGISLGRVLISGADRRFGCSKIARPKTVDTAGSGGGGWQRWAVERGDDHESEASSSNGHTRSGICSCQCGAGRYHRFLSVRADIYSSLVAPHWRNGRWRYGDLDQSNRRI
jgi:hypothetical protein